MDRQPRTRAAIAADEIRTAADAGELHYLNLARGARRPALELAASVAAERRTERIAEGLAVSLPKELLLQLLDTLEAIGDGHAMGGRLTPDQAAAVDRLADQLFAAAPAAVAQLRQLAADQQLGVA